MRTAQLTFHLSDPSLGPDLLHELNLHDEVTAHADADRLVVEIADTAQAAWSVRSTVTLFDPAAREVSA